MIGNCAEFDRWLDDGQPATGAAHAQAHAAGCARCAAALELERVLARPLRAATSPGFVDAVLRRVREAEHARAVARARIEVPIEPWWVRAPAEPAAALALAAASLFAWRADRFWSLCVDAGRVVAGLRWGQDAPLAQQAFAAWSAIGGRIGSGGQAALLLALLPAVLVASWPLYRWVSGAASAPGARGPRRIEAVVAAGR